jgi:DNA helicase-2/ATP-dependent DNA helicase PcrA
VREGIPYQIVSGAAFFDRAEVKDALAYLRFMLNKRDKAAFERIVNIPPRSIGQKTLKRIQLNYAVDWIQALKDTRLAARQKKQTEMLIQLIEQYAGHVDEQPYTVIMQVLKEINYSSYLMTHYDDYEDREGNISELTNVLKGIESEGKSLSSFLEDSVLAHEQDKIQKTESVKVMTVHAAKGLEFPVVFVMGLEEGIFPSGRSMSNRLAVEEERRLFYVAATRAKERLYLSSAAYRMKFGSNAFMSQSRYIEEIQEEIEVSKQRVY